MWKRESGREGSVGNDWETGFIKRRKGSREKGRGSWRCGLGRKYQEKEWGK